MYSISKNRLFGAIGVAALLAATPVLAQDATTQPSTDSSAQQTSSDGSTPSTTTQSDPLLVSVNGSEIRQSDLLTAISTLPPQMQQLPREMLIGLAMDQLVARQLILDAARADNLAEDPEVQSLVEPMVSQITDQAMVQVWLQRELEGQITEENLQQAFAGFQTANPESDATLEQVRPQLLQALQQEALSGLSETLRSGADVVFYDASGNPTDAPSSSSGATSSSSNGGSGSNAGSGSAGEQGSSETGSAMEPAKQ